MGNHLNGPSQIVSLPFFGNDGIVDLPCGEVIPFRGLDVRVAFVMSQIEVRLRPIVGHVNLSVLKGVHRSWVHIDVRIELEKVDPQSPRLKKGSNRCRCQSLS